MTDIDQNPMQKLVDGLEEQMDEQTPDDAYYCPTCGAYSVTAVLQTIRREEFGVENELWGCTKCQYCMIPHTEWRPIDGDSDE